VRQVVGEMKKADKSERAVCRVLSCSRSHIRSKPSERSGEDAALTRKVRAIFEAARGRYGSPRVHDELRDQGVCVARKRVARLMKNEGLVAQKPRKFVPTTDSKHDLPIAPNVLGRAFEPDSQDRVWVGDITYVRTGTAWSYLSVLIDLYSRRVVGWTLSRTLATDGPRCALDDALKERRPQSGILVHHDRGCQYASLSYRQRLERAGATLSMSRKGNCWDNAPSESFFATLKKELGALFISFEAAKVAIAQYIEWYNVTRRHSFNGGLSPVKKELATYMQMVA
jgi:putative transposase